MKHLLKKVLVITIITIISCLMTNNIVQAQECQKYCACFTINNPYNIQVSEKDNYINITWNEVTPDGQYWIIVKKLQGGDYYKEEFIAWEETTIDITLNEVGIYGIYLYCNGNLVDTHIFIYNIILID